MRNMLDSLATNTAAEVMSRYAAGQRGQDIIGPIQEAIKYATAAKDTEIETLRRQFDEIVGNRAYDLLRVGLGDTYAECVFKILNDNQLKIVKV